MTLMKKPSAMLTYGRQIKSVSLSINLIQDSEGDLTPIHLRMMGGASWNFIKNQASCS